MLTIGCDMPRVPADLIESLIARSPAYCSDAPILGCWPAALSSALDTFIEHDAKRAVRGWAESAGAAPIATPMPLANVNTPADLATL